jgi:hypothetical protein
MCTDPNLAWPRSENEPDDFEAVDKDYHDRALAAPADECLQILDEYHSTRRDCTYYSRWYWAARQSAWLAKLVNGCTANSDAKDRKCRRKVGPKITLRTKLALKVLEQDPTRDMPDIDAVKKMDSLVESATYAKCARPIFGGRNFDSYHAAYLDPAGRRRIHELLSRARRKLRQLEQSQSPQQL